MIFEENLINSIKTNDKCCGVQAILLLNNMKDKSHINRPLLNVHSHLCCSITPFTIDRKVILWYL